MTMQSARLIFIGMTLAGLVGFAGCATTAAKRTAPPTVARLYLETTDERATTLVLPLSGVRVAVGTKPVFTETDFIGAEVMQVELGRCLMLQLTSAATRDLYRLTASNQGRRLVLVLNDVASGARRIEGPLAEGAVMIFVEIPDAALPALVESLRQTSAELQRAAARKS